MTTSISVLWLRIAVVYFVIAVLLGVWMGMTGNHSQFPLHAHLNLLGWVSMALFGIVGALYPAVANTLLAKIHFWLYNASLPVMAYALHGVLNGNAGLEPLLGIASAGTALAIVVFAGNVLLNLSRSEAAVRQPASAAA